MRCGTHACSSSSNMVGILCFVVCLRDTSEGRGGAHKVGGDAQVRSRCVAGSATTGGQLL